MSAEVPEGWRTGRFGQFLKAAQGGGTPPRNNPAYWGRDIPWASVKDVTSGASEPLEHITAEGLTNSSSRRVAAGTNILAMRMAVGSVVRYEQEVAINQDLLALIPADSLDSDYLFHWLRHHSPKFSDAATGTTVKGLRKNILLDWPILLPPLDEQRRIAEVLRSVDEAVTENQSAIDAARRIVRQVADEIAANAVGTTSIKRMGEVVTGRTPAPSNEDFWNGDLPFVTPGDIDDGTISVNRSARRLNSSAAHGGKLIPAGSLLVTCIGSTVGKMALTHCEVSTNQQINAVLCPRNLSGYVYVACLSILDDILANAGRQAVPIINKTTFSNLEIPLLSPEAMVEVSATVLALDVEISAAQDAINQLREVRARISFDLLTGRVRVPA